MTRLGHRVKGLVRPLVAAGMGVAVSAQAVVAQGRGPRRGGDEESLRLQEMIESGEFSKYNTPYDGRFVFVRMRFDALADWGGWRRDLKWDHDYPRGELNFAKILREVTLVRPYMGGGNILAADDPELFKYPVAYLCEPGFWTLTEKEATSLRAYLQKGGFLIFDDFEGEHWLNFELQMHKVLPGATLVKLDASSPIFHSFYDIDDLEPLSHDNYRSRYMPAEFYGIFEDNDPKKRLMVIVNYNNDIGEDWEWSGTGFYPIELSNEGYKLGINYIVYALTH